MLPSPSKLLMLPSCLVFVVAAVGSLSAVASTRSTARQVADLKSFFHGEPALPPKSLPPPVTAVVSTAPGLSVDQQIEAFFRAFADAIKARDGRRMTPLLAPAYTIADLPEDHVAAEFFAQAVDRTPGPTAIVIQSIESKGATREVKVELRYPAKISTKTFQFDHDGRLLASDLFMLKRVEHGM